MYEIGFPRVSRFLLLLGQFASCAAVVFVAICVTLIIVDWLSQ